MHTDKMPPIRIIIVYKYARYVVQYYRVSTDVQTIYADKSLRIKHDLRSEFTV